MAVVRGEFVVAAGPRSVAGLLRDRGVAAEALRRCGHRFDAAARWLGPGDEVRVAARVVPGVRMALRTVMRDVAPERVVSVRSAGPIPGLCHTTTLIPVPDGTRVVDEVTWALPLGRALMRRVLDARAQVLVEQVAALRARPVVVATAVIRAGELLAARRSHPPELAGRWELPGGRVEAGEPEPDAVVRECREELALPVRVTGRLGTDLLIDAGVLRAYTAEIVGGAEPVALEHSALRWVGPDHRRALDWLPADRALLGVAPTSS